jgi:hypothetical protein
LGSIVLTSETERRIKILEYLRENSLDKDKKAKKINKADVMRHLEGISRLKTTHGTIINLIKEGKIKMIKDKPYSQTHYLTLNEDNEFNKIIDDLSILEKHIEQLEIPKPKKPPNVPKEDRIMWSMLFKLARVNSLPFEQDSQILYRKIYRLMIELTLKKIISLKQTKEYSIDIQYEKSQKD